MYQGQKTYGPVVYNYAEIANFDEETQTYDITNLASGMFPTYFSIIAKDLNFTYTLHQRKDRVFGTEVDGKPTGMVASVYYNEADMIIYPLAFNSLRR